MTTITTTRINFFPRPKFLSLPNLVPSIQNLRLKNFQAFVRRALTSGLSGYFVDVKISARFVRRFFRERRRFLSALRLKKFCPCRKPTATKIHEPCRIFSAVDSFDFVGGRREFQSDSPPELSARTSSTD